MNANIEMAYLSGGDEVFGPNFGGATVHTNVRAGYVAECPNVGKLVTNLKFSLDDGKRDHGRHPERRRRPEGRRQGMAEGHIPTRSRPGSRASRPSMAATPPRR